VKFADFFKLLKATVPPLLKTWRRQANGRPLVFVMDNAPVHGEKQLPLVEQ
jgi:hypothetical protein